MLDRRCLTTPAACSREGVDLQIYYRKRRDCFRTVVRAKGTRKKKERLGAEKLQSPLRVRRAGTMLKHSPWVDQYYRQHASRQQLELQRRLNLQLM